MVYIGFNVEEKKVEQLKIISFITKKTRTDLIIEGLNLVIDKHKDSFETFSQQVKQLKK